MFKTYLKFGIAAGIFLILYVRLLDLSRIIYTSAWGIYVGYLAILILPTCIFLALKQQKQKETNLKWGRAIITGELIALISATVYNLYTAIDIHLFGAGHLKNQLDFTVESMKKAAYSELEINNRIVSLKEYYWSFKSYVSTYISYILLGIIFSVLFCLLFRLKFKSTPNKLS